jgi:hypothetical protein
LTIHDLNWYYLRGYVYLVQELYRS